MALVFRRCTTIKALIAYRAKEVLTLFKGEVQSRITIYSKERIKISLQIGAKMMKIG